MGDKAIEIFLRIRPSKAKESYLSLDDSDREHCLSFHVPKAEDLVVNNSRTDYRFQFNGILGRDAKQDEVFETVGKNAVNNALNGFNSTIFAYGQTGSGKTFTITGGSERYVDRGIIPRALSMLFAEFKKQSDTQFSVFISYLEIYNETGYDLLDADHDKAGVAMGAGRSKLEEFKKVTMLEDEDGNYHLKNLSMHPVSSEEDALNCLFLGDTNRAVSETEMNLASSRSHCIFTVSIEARKAGADTVVRSKLHLVDLAGSERVHKSANSGQTLKEATYINSSLFFLEMVIVALHEKARKGRTHIPYRNSLMTSVLRDSLGGNCRTVMIATISPNAQHTDESISTCNFAQRVALVKNVAQRNEDVDPQTVIRRLKADLAAARADLDFERGGDAEGQELDAEQLEDLKRKVKTYVDDRDPMGVLDLGKVTMIKMRDAFAIFKNMVLEAREGGGSGGGPAVAELEKQVAALQTSLAQRDGEIAILVNMVKQGKKMPGSAGGPGVGGLAGAAEAKSAGGGPTIIVAEDKEAARMRRIEQLAEKVVCGVKMCRDLKILDDPAESFKYFKDLYPGNEAIEENKALLKAKYLDAKETGEKVNKARSAINYLKSTIEQLRRERAMERVTMGGGQRSDGEEKEVGEGEDGFGGGEDVHPEEVEHRKSIEQEKFVYKENFNKLRDLKSAIEHIQRLLEKSRIKMQQDFDVWYKNCIDFTSYYSKGLPLPSPAPSSISASTPSPHSSLPSSLSVSSSSNNTTILQASSPYLGMDSAVSSAASTPLYGARGGAGEPKHRGGEAEAPGAKQLSGDKEVDDDIMAFYKAKEELLKRQQQNARK